MQFSSSIGLCRQVRELMVLRERDPMDNRHDGFLQRHLEVCPDCRQWAEDSGLIVHGQKLTSETKTLCKPQSNSRLEVCSRRFRDSVRYSAGQASANRRCKQVRRPRRVDNGAGTAALLLVTGTLGLLVGAVYLACGFAESKQKPQNAPTAIRQAPPSVLAKVAHADPGACLVRSGRAMSLLKGTALRENDLLQTNSSARATLYFTNGCTIELDSNTTVAFQDGGSARGLALCSGNIFVRTMRYNSGSPVLINAARQDQVLALGAAFEMTRSPESSCVRVEDGQLTFGLGPEAISVTAGRQSTLSTDGRPMPLACAPTGSIAAWRDSPPSPGTANPTPTTSGKLRPDPEPAIAAGFIASSGPCPSADAAGSTSLQDTAGLAPEAAQSGSRETSLTPTAPGEPAAPPPAAPPQVPALPAAISLEKPIPCGEQPVTGVAQPLSGMDSKPGNGCRSLGSASSPQESADRNPVGRPAGASPLQTDKDEHHKSKDTDSKPAATHGPTCPPEASSAPKPNTPGKPDKPSGEQCKPPKPENHHKPDKPPAPHKPEKPPKSGNPKPEHKSR